MKKLIDGVELLGKTKDSGYKNASYLIRTPHKQYIQLSELLYQTVFAMTLESTETGVAERVGTYQNKIIDENAIRFLIDTRLEPLGIIHDPRVAHKDQKPKNLPKTPDMLHGLKYRMTLLPENAVSRVANLYLPLFNTRIILFVFACVIALNVWVFGFHGIRDGLEQTIYQPALFLMVFALTTLSSLFHEIGHAAGAMYGGSKPGRIGSGVYLIWPAFFTDISDTYRLGRKARLRSDFGGVYFNLIFSIIVGIVYLFTRFEPLLLLIFMQNLTVFHQLLPFLRLDGYYIISDLVGVPDLFMRIKPIVLSVFLRKKTGATKDLKTWVKWVVTAWVIITIPLLVLIVGFILYTAPAVISAAIMSAQIQIQAISASFQNKDYLITVASAVRLFILMLPALGAFYIIYMIGKFAFKRINKKLDTYINIPQFDKRFPQPYHGGNGSYR